MLSSRRRGKARKRRIRLQPPVKKCPFPFSSIYHRLAPRPPICVNTLVGVKTPKEGNSKQSVLLTRSLSRQKQAITSFPFLFRPSAMILLHPVSLNLSPIYVPLLAASTAVLLISWNIYTGINRLHWIYIYTVFI